MGDPGSGEGKERKLITERNGREREREGKRREDYEIEEEEK